jgi:hypothetical protein
MGPERMASETVTAIGTVDRCRRLGKDLCFITVVGMTSVALDVEGLESKPVPPPPPVALPHTVEVTLRNAAWIKRVKRATVVTLRIQPEPSGRGAHAAEEKAGAAASAAANLSDRTVASAVPLATQPTIKFECVELIEVIPAPRGTRGAEGGGGRTKRKRGVTAPPCKWFLQGKVCPIEGCERRHVFATEAEARQAEAKRLSIEQHRAHGAASDVEHIRQHSKRGAVFGEWLVSTYGVEYLRSGSGVLDIAGGKQFVSLYLATAHGVPCTVVDPRPPAPLNPADALVLTQRGHPAPTYIRGEFDQAFAATHIDLVRSCSIVCGQHPDEATEPIVAEAMRVCKPFAVVPCCVFAKQFPRTLDGHAVSEYEDFLLYLLRLSGDVGVQRAEISLGGRNQVLFTLPLGSQLD